MLRKPTTWTIVACALTLTASTSHGQYFHSARQHNAGSWSGQPPASTVYSSSTYSRPAYSYSASHSAYSQPTYSAPVPSYRSYGYQNRAHQSSAYRSSAYRNRTYGHSSYHQSGTRFLLGDFRNLNTASPGYYTAWRTAPGTSRDGYLAADGSRWTLMQSSGRVHVDHLGRRSRLSDASGNQLAWKIERDGIPSKSAWIARDEKTGNISILYRRPQITDDTRFYPATVKLDGGKVTAVSWRIKPSWADQAAIVKGQSTPRLPAASYRSTSQGYLLATRSDLDAAQQAVRTSSASLSARRSRPYDSVPQPAAVPAVQKDSSLSLTVSE